MDRPIDHLPDVDPSRAHPARVYDYWLGGKDNFAADREVAEAMLANEPGIRMMARANRRFLERAVRYLVTEQGIGQFLDVGCGIPTARNTHEVAQELDPGARVVYVDNDPVVAAHSRALLTSTVPGAVAFIAADATDPARILDSPELAALDLDRPVALVLMSFLMYFSDEVAHGIVGTLLDALAPGSCLTVSHPTAVFDPVAAGRNVETARRSGLTYNLRDQDGVAAFFTGLDLVEPGVVPVLGWRPDGAPPADVRRVHFFGGVGRKP
jgi:O-methyltransferase involved in polyketide biosynthesis